MAVETAITYMTAAVGGKLPRRREAEAAKYAEMRSTLGRGKRRTFRTNL
jgi:hypothetical protein